MAHQEIDLFDAANFDDGFPYDYFEKLRRDDPVHWNETSQGWGFWNLTKHEDVRRMSREPHTFSSAVAGTNIWDVPDEDLEGVRSMMLNMDPPKHAKYRRIVAKNFTPRQVATMEEKIRKFASETIDAVANKGEVEFVADIAAQLPMRVINDLMGVPEVDHQKLVDLSNRLIGFDDPEYQGSFNDGREAAAEVCMYALGLAAEVQRCPAHNIANDLLNGKVDGQPLSEMDFGFFFLLLTIAGNETTRTVTSQGMRWLMENRDQYELLVRKPDLIPLGIEEMLRVNPPVMHFRRTLTEDVEIRGKQLKTGQKVVMWYPSANRDEEIFADPNRFDVTRNPNDHLSFGIGEHFCIGAHIARLQLNAIFEQLLGRLADMELVSPPRRLRGNFVDGIKEMHVRFTPEGVSPKLAAG